MSEVAAPAGLAGACQLFLDHWKSLRDGAIVPTLDAWLTHLPASIATQKFRAELLPDDVFVLFNGSANIARRGRNNTGGTLLDGDHEARQHQLSNLRHVISQPCGLWIDRRLHGSTEVTLRTQTIVLPLNLPTGRWPQIVGYTCELDHRPLNVVFSGSAERMRVEWIDVGCATPPLAPA